MPEPTPVTIPVAGTVVWLTTGQSQLANYAQVPASVPWTGEVYDLNLIGGDGLIYRSDGGRTFGDGVPDRISVLPDWANRRVAMRRGVQRVLLVMINVGGSIAAQWCPAGEYAYRLQAAYARLGQLGLLNNIVRMHVLGQGDVGANTTTNNFVGQTLWQFDWERGLGLPKNRPIIVGQGVHWTNVSNVYPDRATAIRLGQRLVAQNAGAPHGLVLLGPDEDVYPDSERVDGVHPAAGMRFLWGRDWLSADYLGADWLA